MTGSDSDITKTVELVRLAQDGDRAALDRLIDRYYERVRRIVRIRLGRRLRRDFDSGDILQQTFVTAVQRFDRFDMIDEASLINWLAKLAEHQITDAAHWQNAERRNPDRVASIEPDDPEADDSAMQVADSNISPIDAIAKGEEQDLLEESLTELDPLYRELILLRDYAGHAWKDVARLTGRPSPDAARVMYSQALLKLGRLIKLRKRESLEG